ncbi:MAG TPA: hypothetical protein PK074_11550 [Spirochaetales bacterium]|nr:hypothetical protein [Spirochaetales bacterium]
MKEILKNASSILFNTLQLIIFGLCFLLFTSTIEVFPWYEPLTMGAFMLLMVIAPIQALMSLIICGTQKSTLTYKRRNLISIINTGILFIAFFIGTSNVDLFYPFAMICAFVECLLAVSFIIIITRQSVDDRK